MRRHRHRQLTISSSQKAVREFKYVYTFPTFEILMLSLPSPSRVDPINGGNGNQWEGKPTSWDFPRACEMVVPQRQRVPERERKHQSGGKDRGGEKVKAKRKSATETGFTSELSSSVPFLSGVTWPWTWIWERISLFPP